MSLELRDCHHRIRRQILPKNGGLTFLLAQNLVHIPHIPCIPQSMCAHSAKSTLPKAYQAFHSANLGILL